MREAHGRSTAVEVPDFIPVAGYLDDSVIVAFVMRHVLSGSDPKLIETGPPWNRRSS